MESPTERTNETIEKKKGFGDYKKLAQKIESYALTPGELLTEYP